MLIMTYGPGFVTRMVWRYDLQSGGTIDLTAWQAEALERGQLRDFLLWQLTYLVAARRNNGGA